MRVKEEPEKLLCLGAVIPTAPSAYSTKLTFNVVLPRVFSP